MSTRVNLLLPEVRANPYPLYGRLRRESPVCELEPGGMFAVSRYADVMRALKHPGIFSSQGFSDLLTPDWLDEDVPVARSIIVMDPPQHGRQRALVSKAFGPSLLARYEPRVREIAARLAEGLADSDEVDFVARFSGRLPTLVIADLLGFDSSYEQAFRRWGYDLAEIAPAPPAPERIASIRRTLAEMQRYLGEVIAARRREPRADLTSALVQAEVDGELLSDDQIASFLSLLLPAGTETTTNLLSNAMLLLTQRRDLLERLRAAPADIPRFIEEMLRYDPPVHGIPRLTAEDVTIAGVDLPRGTFLILLLGSANRDEDHFPDPDRFDMDRPAQGAVPFGHGPHFCLGAALARIEARVALEELLARFAGIARTPGELPYPISITVRGPLSLPLRLQPA